MLGVERTEGALDGGCALSGLCSTANGRGDNADIGGGLMYSGAGSACRCIHTSQLSSPGVLTKLWRGSQTYVKGMPQSKGVLLHYGEMGSTHLC